MTIQVPVSGKSLDQLPQVVIVGAGFGGMNAALQLKRHPVRVTLVDRHNYHLFQPLLYQVATAGISPDGIAYPVRTIFRGDQNATFRMTNVTGVDYEHKLLLTDTIEIPYDYLILAMGGETNYFGIESVEKNGFGLKDLHDATNLRNHVLSMFEQAVQEADPERCKAMLTFIVVGGGPTGVECAGALSELVRVALAREYLGLNTSKVRIVLLEAADRLLAAMPRELSRATLRTLREKKHVEVQFGAQVTGFDGEQVTFKDGTVIPSRTLVWAAGVRAADLADRLDEPQARLKRVVVQPTLQLPDHPEVFVIGDASYLEQDGQPLPMVAPVAIQQAKVAAQNVLNCIAGQPLVRFRYRDPGTLSTIGRNQAVAWLGRWKFTGFLAWWLWLWVHLYQLIGFRNRLLVLVSWVWDYIFYDRSVRLITKE